MVHPTHTLTVFTHYTPPQLISQGATSSGLDELVIAIRRSQDPYSLSEKILPHLETLQRNDVTNNETCEAILQLLSVFSLFQAH